MMARRDHDGIMLDMLDDIVRAEDQARVLVDRLDCISNRPYFRVVDIEMYLWIVASVAIASCVIGIVAGYILRGLHG